VFTDDPATYYDVLEPIGGATKPTMVLVHGGGHTGACFLATIDNRPAGHTTSFGTDIASLSPTGRASVGVGFSRTTSCLPMWCAMASRT